MNTSTQKRIARLSGLLVLALLVVALAVPAALAMRDFSTGTGGSSTSAESGTINALQFPTLVQVQQHQGVGSSTSAGSGTSSAEQRQIGWAWGRAYADVAAARPLTLAQLQQISSRKNRAGSASGVASVPLAPATGAAPASPGSSSTTAWIVAGSATAALVIALVAWALIRRRRQPSVPGSSAYCELHPGDALCGAA